MRTDLDGQTYPGRVERRPIPLFLVWFVAIYKLCGLNPVGWHLATLLVHLVATFLVGRLVARVLRDDTAGGVAADVPSIWRHT